MESWAGFEPAMGGLRPPVLGPLTTRTLLEPLHGVEPCSLVYETSASPQCFRGKSGAQGLG